MGGCSDAGEQFRPQSVEVMVWGPETNVFLKEHDTPTVGKTSTGPKDYTVGSWGFNSTPQVVPLSEVPGDGPSRTTWCPLRLCLKGTGREGLGTD